MKLLALFLLSCGLALTACGSSKYTALLSNHAIGQVRLGLPRERAVDHLSAIFGRPSRRDFTNSGCAPAYTEVGWQHLYVEFTRGRLSGYRYIKDGWPSSSFGTRLVPSDLPRLVTTRGITLGSTLGQARAAYHRLRPVGTNRWQTPDGLVLYDNTTHFPDAASSRIVEIKLSTCGDF